MEEAVKWLGAAAMVLGAFIVACGDFIGLLGIAAGAVLAGVDWERPDDQR